MQDDKQQQVNVADYWTSAETPDLTVLGFVALLD